MAYVHEGMTRSDLLLAFNHAIINKDITAGEKAKLMEHMYTKIEAVYEVLFQIERVGEKQDSVGEMMKAIGEVLRMALEK